MMRKIEKVILAFIFVTVATALTGTSKATEANGKRPVCALRNRSETPVKPPHVMGNIR